MLLKKPSNSVLSVSSYELRATCYEPIIGLEIHVELKTNSKMFCGCKNDPFGAPKPNIYTCPVCLGLPGALPVPNKKAIEWTVQLGLALGCTINKESKFDRKHYFYPDLPKGYQISQYDRPFCVEGQLVIARPFGSESLRLEESEATRQSQSKTDRHAPQSGARDDRVIKIRRVHLEEDTAKMLHRTINGEKVSLIDFNRSGVPLVEIVTEPDIHSAEEAKEFAKKIHQIVRSLEISDADMEKGSMRLEANISLKRVARGVRPETTSSYELRATSLPPYKVELKNINSFRFLEKAINSELERQEQLLSQGKVVGQETRGWDSTTQTTKPQRTKEEAADYRYFPEPDIPPILFTDREISNLKSQIPKMSGEIREELIQLGTSEQAAEIISTNKILATKVLEILRGKSFDFAQDRAQSTRNFSNWLLHHQEESKKKLAEEIIAQFKNEKTEIVGEESKLAEWVKEVILNNPKAVEDFSSGKESALQFLIGQVQRLAKGKADIRIVKDMLLSSLSSHPERSRGI